MKNLVNIARMIALYGQLGFTIVTPPVVMALLGHWLQTVLSIGGWIMVVCIVLGLVASASGAWSFYRRIMAAENRKKEKRTETVTFYHHE